MLLSNKLYLLIKKKKLQTILAYKKKQTNYIFVGAYITFHVDFFFEALAIGANYS